MSKMKQLAQQSQTRGNVELDEPKPSYKQYPQVQTTPDAKTKYPTSTKKYVPSLMMQVFSKLAKLPDLDVAMTPEAFLKITGWSTTDAPNETAGHGIFQDGKIVWVCKASITRQGGSDVESGTTESIIAAIGDGYDPDAINMQWHTHPGFSAFHSSTDVDNEIKIVEPLTKQTRDGRFYFIVASGFEWVVRKYVWFDGVLLGYHEGYVTVPEYNIKLDQGSTSRYTTYSYSTNYTGGKYKNGVYQSTSAAKQDQPIKKEEKKAINVLESPCTWLEEIDGELVEIDYDPDNAPPESLDMTAEIQCYPIFKKFGVKPLKWKELALEVWEQVTDEESKKVATVESKAAEAQVLLDAIVGVFLEDPKILEDIL